VDEIGDLLAQAELERLRVGERAAHPFAPRLG
jgi:hypothetical protein